jgi:hypothetical protein
VDRDGRLDSPEAQSTSGTNLWDVTLGSFLSSDELARSADRRLGDVLTTVRGLGVVQGKAGRAYVLSKRRVATLRAPPPRYADDRDRNTPGDDTYYPQRAEESQGIIAACYARVYLDNQLLNPSSPAEPINVNEYFARDLIGIEYYSGPSTLPTRYNKLNSNCGVVVLHSRRGPQAK